jgi:hypothetical protein
MMMAKVNQRRVHCVFVMDKFLKDDDGKNLRGGVSEGLESEMKVNDDIFTRLPEMIQIKRLTREEETVSFLMRKRENPR